MKRLFLASLLFWSPVVFGQPTPFQWLEQTNLTTKPPTSASPLMTYDSVRHLSLCVPGGYGAFQGLWRWNASVWLPPTDASTSQRTNAVKMVFDSVRGVAVLFCDSGSWPNPGQTWEWDGSIWRLASTTGMGSRDEMAMAFDAQRARTIAIGGSDGLVGPLTAETWEWDGNTWQVVATNGPSQRTGSAMVYDAKRQVIVLFGGVSGLTVGSQRFGDTWTWNGDQWTLVASNGPSPRAGHAMVYDAARERVLLYGGSDGNEPAGQLGLGDLWEWDGSQWLLSTPSAPRRSDAALSFDLNSGQTVMFGGYRDLVPLQETWLVRHHETWVDFNYVGTEAGSFDRPFNTLTEGVNNSPPGAALKIKPGSSPELLTVSKRVSVQAVGGPVTIGQ
jgi:hypothetical protein